MSERLRRTLGGLLAVVALLPLRAPTASANSAEPPRVIVYFAGGAPGDAAISVVFGDGAARPMEQRRAGWERYDVYHKSLEESAPIVALRVESGVVSIDIPVETLSAYNNVFTLNFARGTVTDGKSPARTALLVALRVLLTLILEGCVFFLFGYRQKRGYAIFLIVNLVTQGALNAALSGALYPIGYEIFGLVFGELFVFAAEMISFPLLLREHGKVRAALCALCANLLSLVAGGLMLSWLPL